MEEVIGKSGRGQKMAEKGDLVLTCGSCGREAKIGRSSFAPDKAASVISNQCPDRGGEDYDRSAFYHDIMGWKLEPFGLVGWPGSPDESG